jgi:hypothetical protein
MSDLDGYVKKRKRGDPEFAEGFEVGYSISKLAFCSDTHARKPR